jgi:hypothetical protein
MGVFIYFPFIFSIYRDYFDKASLNNRQSLFSTTCVTTEQPPPFHQLTFTGEAIADSQHNRIIPATVKTPINRGA